MMRVSVWTAIQLSARDPLEVRAHCKHLGSVRTLAARSVLLAFGLRQTDRQTGRQTAFGLSIFSQASSYDAGTAHHDHREQASGDL